MHRLVVYLLWEWLVTWLTMSSVSFLHAGEGFHRSQLDLLVFVRLSRQREVVTPMRSGLPAYSLKTSPSSEPPPLRAPRYVPPQSRDPVAINVTLEKTQTRARVSPRAHQSGLPRRENPIGRGLAA